MAPILSTKKAFFAELQDGQLLAWGAPTHGADISEVKSTLESVGVQGAWSNEAAFLTLLKDGQWLAWGQARTGGDISAVKPTLDSVGVKGLWHTGCAFLAELRDGQFLAWGLNTHGADINAVKPALESVGAKRVWSNQGAFLVELKNGQFHAWGMAQYGADIRAVKSELESSGVKTIWNTNSAFLAELKDGQFFAWGNEKDGGDMISAVKSTLESVGVRRVWSNSFAFLVQQKDGQFLAWGRGSNGADISAVKPMLDVGVRGIWSTNEAFLASLRNGQFIAWGDAAHGGNISDVKPALESTGVRTVWSTGHAFLVQLKDGKFLGWGPAISGGDVRGVQLALETVGLTHRVRGLRVPKVWKAPPPGAASGSAFAAVKHFLFGESDPSHAEAAEAAETAEAAEDPLSLAFPEDFYMNDSSVREASVKVRGAETAAVVKTMRLHEPDTEKLAERLRQIKGIQGLQHDSLVKIFDVYAVKPTMIRLAMEPAERSLRRLLQDEPQAAQQQQLPLARGIASAMAFLHSLEEPILHGELKPENVLIFGSEAKVSDVGFNMAGRGTGAVAYKAPEIYDGAFTSASEVYAFAMICWELVTGKRAWGEYTDLQIMKPVCVEHRRPPLDEKTVTTRLGQIVQESWASDPAKRPSFTQLLVQLAPEPKLPKSLPTALPSHWSGQDLDQGWIAVPASEDLFRELSKLFVVSQPRELGTGRDAGKYHRPYSNLKLWSAWRIEHQSLWDKYAAERNDVIRLLRQLEKSKLQTAEWKSKLEKAHAQMPDPLCEHIGEKYLLHGTSPEVLLDILHQGFNDKLASLKGMFGAGAYFAEDPEKIDQYTREDPGHEAPGLEKLHARLYRAGGNRHPGSDVFYCFVVRVTCGACFVSNGLKDKLHDHDTGFQVFARDDRRELSSIPESDPRVPYHTLVVQTGAEARLRIERFREIISFDANRAYPEYLLAYQRV